MMRDAFLLGEANREERRRSVRMACVLVAVGVVGTLLLLDHLNIETTLAVSLVAGMVCRRAYVVVVPVATVTLTAVAVHALRYPGMFTPVRVAGLTAFLVTGYLFVALLGKRARPRTLLRTRSIAIATAVSIPATVAWDVWTMLGEWYFIAPDTPLEIKLQMQVSFTLMHLLSSLLFVPLIGAGMALYSEHAFSAPGPAPSQQRLELPP